MVNPDQIWKDIIQACNQKTDPDKMLFRKKTIEQKILDERNKRKSEEAAEWEEYIEGIHRYYSEKEEIRKEHYRNVL